MSTKDKYTLMTTAPIPRLIGSLAVPTIISMLVTSFYVMADTYFVGQINTTVDGCGRNFVLCYGYHSGFWILFRAWVG